MAVEVKKIIVVPYDSQWPKIFSEEKIKIKKALGEDVFLEHVGSTSVLGLAAKPKIDMIAAVEDPVKKKVFEKLEALGYKYSGEWNIPGKFGFAKRAEFDFNLHLFSQDHPELELNLVFRDFLRKNSDVRDAYAKLKFDLLKDPKSCQRDGTIFVGYTMAKGDFIREVLKKAGFNEFRMLRCSDETEWAAVNRLRLQKYGESCEVLDHHSASRENEYFVFYRGVDILAYANVKILPNQKAEVAEMVVDHLCDVDAVKKAFLSVVQSWVDGKGLVLLRG